MLLGSERQEHPAGRRPANANVRHPHATSIASAPTGWRPECGYQHVLLRRSRNSQRDVSSSVRLPSTAIAAEAGRPRTLDHATAAFNSLILQESSREELTCNRYRDPQPQQLLCT